MLAASARGAGDPTLARLRSGELLAGIAFAYLRRPDPPAVGRPAGARRRPGGRRRGPVGDVVGPGRPVRGGRPAGDDVVFFLLDGASPPPGRCGLAPLALAAMNASSTVRLALRRPGRARRRRDLGPAVRDVAGGRPVTTARPRPPASAWPAPAAASWATPPSPPSWTSAGAGPTPSSTRTPGRRDDEHLAALTEARAWSCELAVRAATALVVAGGGRSILRSNPAQRLLREAAFFTIQAQTPTSGPPPWLACASRS